MKNYGNPIPKMPTDGGIASRQAQRARCTNGDHDVTTVPANRVVYTEGGRRRPEGERYCRACGERIARAAARLMTPHSGSSDDDPENDSERQ